MKRIAVVRSKHVALWCALFLAIFVTTACSINKEKRENVYRQAQTEPKLKVPEDLKQPAERRSLMDVPEDLDTGEISKGLELPPVMTGVDLESDVEKNQVATEDEETGQEKEKEKLQSEIISKSDNTQLLLVKSDIDTVWPRVAIAIKELGFNIDDSNRGKFYYSISREFERLQTIQDPSKPVEMGLETPKEEYLIYVEPGEERIEISVRNTKREIEGTVLAKQLLQQIKNSIDQP